MKPSYDKGRAAANIARVPLCARVSKKDGLKATAYHEAGHAVASWYQGLKFKEASIVPNSDEGTLGHVLTCRFPKWFDPEIDATPKVRLRAEAEIMSLFAGQIAEAKFRGRKPRFGMESDNQHAVEFGRYFASGDTLEAFLHFLFLSSRDLVNRRWREIGWVAEELLSGKRLTYNCVKEVIDRGYGFKPAAS
jgi:hypothetical protein